MRTRTLGWAGLEVLCDDYRLLIDPLLDPGPFAPFVTGPQPELMAPGGPADAALLTHLHRDHADAGTLRSALRMGAPLLGPPAAVGPGHLGVEVAERELRDAGLELRRMAAGESAELGPFTVTAVDAVDGTGDPQVSWVVASAGVRIVHGGDTVWHGAWWRIAERHGPFAATFLPANGARIAFPHLQPAADVPASMTPQQAVEAARALGAGCLVAIHHGVIEHETFYRPHPDVPGAVARAAAERGLDARVAVAGEELSW